MHPAAFEFVRRTVQALPPLRVVIEFGSRNVNGTVREIFTDAVSYTGIDLKPGPGVDFVADATAVCFDGEFADCVVCCEVFEHCKDFAKLARSAFRALRPGGFFIVTCASQSRLPHSADGDGPPKPGEYYHGVSFGMMSEVLEGAGFLALLHQSPEAGDVYALGLKAR